MTVHVCAPIRMNEHFVYCSRPVKMHVRMREEGRKMSVSVCV